MGLTPRKQGQNFPFRASMLRGVEDVEWNMCRQRLQLDSRNTLPHPRGVVRRISTWVTNYIEHFMSTFLYMSIVLPTWVLRRPAGHQSCLFQRGALSSNLQLRSPGGTVTRTFQDRPSLLREQIGSCS